MWFMFSLFFVMGLVLGFTALSEMSECPKSKFANFIAGFWAAFGIYVYLVAVLAFADSLYPSGEFTIGVLFLLTGGFGIYLLTAILLFRYVERIEREHRNKAWARHDALSAEYLKKSH